MISGRGVSPSSNASGENSGDGDRSMSPIGFGSFFYSLGLNRLYPDADLKILQRVVEKILFDGVLRLELVMRYHVRWKAVFKKIGPLSPVGSDSSGVSHTCLDDPNDHLAKRFERYPESSCTADFIFFSDISLKNLYFHLQANVILRAKPVCECCVEARHLAACQDDRDDDAGVAST